MTPQTSHKLEAVLVTSFGQIVCCKITNACLGAQVTHLLKAVYMKTDHGKRTLILLVTKGGPALRTPGVSFLPTSNLLSLGHRKIIIDCGIGVTQALARSGHSASAITDIFITHLHSDHVLELGGLIHTAWTSGL